MSVIKSMTAYASVKKKCQYGSISLDIKSLNSRYLEVTFKVPDELRHIEAVLRDKLKALTPRGKIEVFLAFDANQDDMAFVDDKALEKLSHELNKIVKNVANAQVSVTDILNMPGILKKDTAVAEAIDKEIATSFDTLLQNFERNKIEEGTRLASAVSSLLEKVEIENSAIEHELDTLVANERDRLHQRLLELKVDVDPQRFENEVALLAQKSDIREEYDRVKSHIEGVRNILKEGGSCGKRLDFMMQELNREANTMASKASMLNITKVAVELKVLIEQMREQVQNIE